MSETVNRCPRCQRQYFGTHICIDPAAPPSSRSPDAPPCGARDEANTCLKPRGHDGPHVEYDAQGHSVAAWSAEPAPRSSAVDEVVRAAREILGEWNRDACWARTLADQVVALAPMMVRLHAALALLDSSESGEKDGTT